MHDSTKPAPSNGPNPEAERFTKLLSDIERLGVQGNLPQPAYK